jgi:hypothetical protein
MSLPKMQAFGLQFKTVKVCCILGGITVFSKERCILISRELAGKRYKINNLLR